MATATKKRHSARIQKQVRILLIGSDSDGRVFAEETATVTLSRHGAGVISRYKLVPEQELVLRCLDTNKETEVRVVGSIGSGEARRTYGLTFLDLDYNFWGLDFPPASPMEEEARYCVLECMTCKHRQTFHHSDVESDIFKINGQLEHYCPRCGLPTIWKRAIGEAVDFAKVVHPEPSAALASPTQALPPLPPKSKTLVTPAESALTAGTEDSEQAPRVNRRRRPRAKVNLTGCVRYAGSDNDMVICEDMSRGGLRFKSAKRYYVNSIIEVAAPYTQGNPAIFVTAEIVYVLELPEQKMYRCGVAFSNVENA